MTAPPLDPALIVAEQRRSYLAARGGASAPAAGAIYWLALGVVGFFITGRNWCLLAFVTSGAIFPLAIALQRPLGANLFERSAFASLTFPTLLPVMLCFGFTIPAFYVAPQLVPLGLCIGMTVHWPTIGWMYGKERAFSVHAIARTAAAVTLYFVFPDDRRYALIPLATGLVYAVTFAWIMYDVRRAERASAVHPVPAE